MLKSIKNNLIFRTGVNLVSMRTALIGFIIVMLLIICSVFSTWISGYNPDTHGDIVADRYLPPSLSHPFGTDKFGRDLLSRVLYGGRISLFIALSVVCISTLLGIAYGSFAGYAGGRIDSIMMRFLDFLLAFPLIFLVITLIALYKMTHWYLIPLLAFTSWMETARLIRAEVLSLKERDYILAVQGLGYSHLRILFVHVIPNCFSVILVTIPMKIAEVILLESALSFLGIGIQPPTASWGNIINDGREVLTSAWWISTIPGIFITITVLSFHLISDGIKNSISIAN
ncbi:MAG: ABC transporter permease [Calditrichaceae bacterium]|jgi:peptide/nickel transport system permease protein